MTQGELFDDGPVAIDLPGADVDWFRGVLAPDLTGPLLEALRTGVAWRQDHLLLYGREVAVPRLQQWFGDPGARYSYSGIDLEPEPWSPPLLALRSVAEHCAGESFNSALVNLYRDGSDHLSWHADDEPELGRHPTIASVSLGAPRRFALRRRDDHRAKVEIELGDGDVLVMRGATQAVCEHAVPRTRLPVGPRVNLTFRRIVG